MNSATVRRAINGLVSAARNCRFAVDDGLPNLAYCFAEQAAHFAFELYPELKETE